MSKNYATGGPVGNNQVPFYNAPPAELSKGSAARLNASASSILVLSTNTTAVEVSADTSGAAIKWLTQATVDSSVAGTSVITGQSTSNFDGLVAAGETRHFVIPIQNSASHDGAQLGANSANNLYTHVAIKSIGVGSVATIEY